MPAQPLEIGRVALQDLTQRQAVITAEVEPDGARVVVDVRPRHAVAAPLGLRRRSRWWAVAPALREAPIAVVGAPALRVAEQRPGPIELRHPPLDHRVALHGRVRMELAREDAVGG